MDNQIAPPPTLAERIKWLSDQLRDAIRRDATTHTKSSLEEVIAANKAFATAVNEAVQLALPPAPPKPAIAIPAFIALPIAVRERAAAAVVRALRHVSGEGTKAEQQAIAAAVWNCARAYSEEKAHG